MSDAQQRLNQVDRHYELVANEFRERSLAAAAAKGEYVKQRAKAVLRFKSPPPNDPGARMSHAEAETRADADDTIADLYQASLNTAALANSAYEKLKQLREASTNARKEVDHEREVDKIHAFGRSGAA